MNICKAPLQLSCMGGGDSLEAKEREGDKEKATRASLSKTRAALKQNEGYDNVNSALMDAGSRQIIFDED